MHSVRLLLLENMSKAPTETHVVAKAQTQTQAFVAEIRLLKETFQLQITGEKLCELLPVKTCHEWAKESKRYLKMSCGGDCWIQREILGFDLTRSENKPDHEKDLWTFLLTRPNPLSRQDIKSLFNVELQGMFAYILSVVTRSI